MTILRSLFILGLLIFLSPIVFQDAQASDGIDVSESSCVMINGDNPDSNVDESSTSNKPRDYRGY